MIRHCLYIFIMSYDLIWRDIIIFFHCGKRFEEGQGIKILGGEWLKLTRFNGLKRPFKRENESSVLMQSAKTQIS